MREAIAALLDLAFGRLGLNRIEADVDPRNERSLAVLERLGFRREGLLRERHIVAGEIQDSVMLGLLARQWRPTAPPTA
jgi:RimJ/RimL family protein N-acetyltransferase